MSTQKPVWAADTPVSMPEPSEHPPMVEMFGWVFTPFGLAHGITEAEYRELRIPHFAPQDPSQNVVRGDEGL
jgi:hypothetical protein